MKGSKPGAKPETRLDKSKTEKGVSVKEKKNRKNTSLRLDSKTLKALKIQAVKDDSSVQRILEHLVAGYLSGKFKLDK